MSNSLRPDMEWRRFARETESRNASTVAISFDALAAAHASMQRTDLLVIETWARLARAEVQLALPVVA